MRAIANGLAQIGTWLDDFDGDALRDWARGFGVDTYVGSSGRVFPMDRKAAPLLRGWVRRLRDAGVHFHVQHRWLGWDDAGALRFATAGGETMFVADAVVLATGRRQLATAWFQMAHGSGY
jgi:predicted flavoprotein YhiN